MNEIKGIYSNIKDKFTTIYNKYNIDDENYTKYEYDFNYLNNHSERELLAARKQFGVLIKLLLNNRSNVCLDMDLDSLLKISNNSIVYLRGYEEEVIKEIYSSYVIKYLNLLKGFLENNLVDKSSKDFLVGSFVNDYIYNFCKKGTYKINLLCLNYNNIYSESKMYLRSKICEAKDIFSKSYNMNNYSAWQADYNDKLFDLSFLSSSDIYELYYIIKYKVDAINKAFINTVRADRFD